MASQTSKTNKPKTTARSTSRTLTKKTTCKSQVIPNSQLASKTNGQKIVARGETIPSYIREISHTVREIAASCETVSNRWSPRTK